MLRRDPEDRWAAAFGRIAGYSFAVAVVTGILLLPFFRPSMAPLTYRGSYRLLDGVPVSQAYQSVLRISFDVRGGLLVRQVHHWSADLFVAAICLRLLRVFFRGRFSGRALPGWLIWVALLALGILAAYTGTILPDDGLSGGSLSVITGVLLSVPVTGTHLVFWIFGGAPPGQQIIGRDYWVHILVLPALAGALLLVSFRSSLRWPRRVRLDPLLPFTCAALVLLGTIAQINPVWLIGPYQPGSITSGAVPDWYMGFLDGPLRLMPAWEVSIGGHPLDLGVLIPGLVVPAAVLHPPGPVPADRPLDHRRARRPGEPHRGRGGRGHVLRPAVGRGRQRPDRLPPGHPALHGDLDVPACWCWPDRRWRSGSPGSSPTRGPRRQEEERTAGKPAGSCKIHKAATPRSASQSARSWTEARCHDQAERPRAGR